ncbi:tetratricopeptide repeat protein [Corallococcus sp. Z5C101001]|uniref:serine/threonine-protein kinase n=1 Tax=Corallococcus sp. Z5C101001 TaxID=2596829 RepID=UPI001180678B|nr:serine/threonine-protein kinase [Corallococcus sp. Z5C101001]TSC25147.1 serine/threonine protein kinase [Corallococcus sp. Z5C101001]
MANRNDRDDGPSAPGSAPRVSTSRESYGTGRGSAPATGRGGGESTPSRGGAGAESPRLSSRQVGRFLPLKVLGQGGMGVVYAAYDPDLDRKVALKLLRVKGGHEDLELGRARLLREAQAMARISHPNVIPVFEVGQWDEQIYVAMALVDGGTLRDWTKAKARTWQELLDKYLAAGRGLEAAHVAGLVHRDFKPANVLVGRDGRVYVTDFGLARPMGEVDDDEEGDGERTRPVAGDDSPLNSQLTQAGLVMGTPAYMSPEQFRGELLDSRSDQFSFCAALYRALYGIRPFDPDELSRVASQLRPRGGPDDEPGVTEAAVAQVLPLSPIQEPPRESKVPAWVRRALMKGLSLEPRDRFRSMAELLTVLGQRERRALARRRAGAAVAATVVLGVAGGVAWSRTKVCEGAQGLVAERWGQDARERVTQAFLATKNPVAQDMARRVGDVLDDYGAEWAKQHTLACEDTRVRAVQTEALLSQRFVCLERRRKDLGALVATLETADVALVDKSLDAAYALPAPGDCADVESLAELQPRPADPVKRAELDALEGQLAEVKARIDTSRMPKALELARQVEARVLATGYLPLMAELRYHLGWARAVLGDKAAGGEVLEQAVYDAEAGRADRLAVLVMNKLLYVDGEQAQYPLARRWGRLGEATLKRVGGDAVLESDLKVNEANLALMQDDPDEALKLLEQASGLLAKALPEGHPKRARVTFTLGRTLLETGKAAQAVTVLKDALLQTEKAMGPVHLDTARRHQALSMALREQRDFTGALEHARVSVSLHRTLLGPASVKLAEALDEEGMSLLALKRYPEALKDYEEALAVKQAKLGPDDELLQYSLDGVGQALLGLGRARDAIAPLRQALAFKDAQEDSLGESGFALAQALWKEGEQEDARGAASQALARFTSAGRASQAKEVEAWLQARPERPAKAVPASAVRGGKRKR